MGIVQDFLRHPVRTTQGVATHYFPKMKWGRFDTLARKAGLNQLYFILSFDCDTHDDARCVLKVDERLRVMGINPIYAVPGEILEEGLSTYTELAQRGAEFINHGHTKHTFWNTDNNRHESCYFYDELSLDEVRRDIEMGDATVKRVLNIAPKGYRTPHFGCFQSDAQLAFIHKTLETLGYDYSTSTIPCHAFTRGPAFKDFGLYEFPVSGWWRNPFAIQDSWGYLGAPHATLGPKGYLEHATITAEKLNAYGYTGLLNYYVDPSHIHDCEEFFEAVSLWADVAIPTTYTNILKELKQ